MAKRWISGLAVLLLFVQGAAFAASSSQDQKLDEANSVLTDFINIPENAIPAALLKKAYGIAVIPSVIKLGFIVGGRHGNGVLAVRTKNGAWSNPVFVSITGGSIGWQIGASSTDIVLVFKSKRSIDRIADGTVTLGGDASVAAGPVGRSASASTNAHFDAEVYSYSRARGLFAGVSVNGAAISIDDTADSNYYGKGQHVDPYTILGRSDTGNLPESGKTFVTTLERFLPRPSDYQNSQTSAESTTRQTALPASKPAPAVQQNSSTEQTAPAAQNP